MESRKFLFVFFAIAMIIPPGLARGATLSLNLSPEYPGSHSEVLASLEGNVDLKRSEVLWYLGGSIISRGVGQRDLSFKTGKAGSKQTLRAVVRASTGETFEVTRTILPSDIDILWEADSSVPAFYKGKALPSPDTEIRVTALPNIYDSSGAKLKPSGLFYSWTINLRPAPHLSGQGKQNISLKSNRSIGTPEEVSVSVSTANGVVVGKNTTKIPVTASEVRVYKEHPLGGTLFNKSLGKTVEIVNQEVVLRAEPFFFSRKDLENDKVFFNWTVDGKAIEPDESSPNLFILRSTSDLGARVTVEVKNANSIFQNALRTILVSFEKSSSLIE